MAYGKEKVDAAGQTNAIELAEQAAAVAAEKAATQARKAERAAYRKPNPLPFNNIMAVLRGQQASYKKLEERAWVTCTLDTARLNL